MTFFGKSLNKVIYSDLDLLVNTPVEEGVTIDFNRRLPTKKDNENDEESWVGLAKVVSAFANTHGGSVLLGVTEEKGIAKEILGIKIQDWEQLRQKINQKLAYLIEPGIDNLTLKESRRNNLTV